METARTTAYYLQLQYGQAVQLEYVDMADESTRARFADLYSAAEERGYAYPLVVIDGQLMMAGSAHVYQVLPMVEQAMEAKEPSA